MSPFSNLEACSHLANTSQQRARRSVHVILKRCAAAASILFVAMIAAYAAPVTSARQEAKLIEPQRIAATPVSLDLTVANANRQRKDCHLSGECTNPRPTPTPSAPPPVVEPPSDKAVKRTTKPPAPKPPVNVPTSCNQYSGYQATACAMVVAKGGWGLGQMPCLVNLWMKESHWNPTAKNRSSGAYGIPQALPGSKMASAGADWATNAETQIRWGIGYIAGRYGNPCGAWSHSQATGWY